MDRDTPTRPEIVVRPATWPADEATALPLLRRYADYLAALPTAGPPVAIHGYDDELASLAQTWGEPNGVLLLAFVAGVLAGCVAVKARADRQCEMKRLWVEPHMRGCRLGRTLVLAAMAWSHSAKRTGAAARHPSQSHAGSGRALPLPWFCGDGPAQ